MATVYILQGTTGRYYIGATRDFDTRFAEHQKGGVHTTKRLGLPVVLVVKKDYPTISEAMSIEKKLKSWKNPKKAIASLTQP